MATGEIAQPGGYIQRTLVVGNDIYSLSDLGIQANNLDTLDQVAWLGF
jgi:hypothetical protein